MFTFRETPVFHGSTPAPKGRGSTVELLVWVQADASEEENSVRGPADTENQLCVHKATGDAVAPALKWPADVCAPSTNSGMGSCC